MGMTLVEKILAKKSGQPSVKPDEIVDVSVDLAMTHDALGAHTAAKFAELGVARVWDPQKIVVIPDHYVPNKDIDTARKCLNLKRFVIEQGIEKYYEVGKGGICHQVLMEKGHVLLIDELHDNFHPLMVKFLVELFHSNETNKSNAQLVFTTHEISILNLIGCRNRTRCTTNVENEIQRRINYIVKCQNPGILTSWSRGSGRICYLIYG